MWGFKFKPIDVDRAFLYKRSGMTWREVGLKLHRRYDDVRKSTEYYHKGSMKHWKHNRLAGIAKIKERTINKYGFENEEQYLEWLDRDDY